MLNGANIYEFLVLDEKTQLFIWLGLCDIKGIVH